MRNAMKLIAILVIQCHAINVSAQKNAFDRYIESFDGFIDTKKERLHPTVQPLVIWGNQCPG